jgi:hypothetical protein
MAETNNTETTSKYSGEFAWLDEAGLKRVIVALLKLVNKNIANSVTSSDTDPIDVLNGTGDGSVSKIVADEVATIVAGADESFDTLKEISDWISSHAESAAAMNSQISDNTSAIEAVSSLLGELPEDADVDTIVAYIDSKTGDTSELLGDGFSKDNTVADALKKLDEKYDEYTDSLSETLGDGVSFAEGDTVTDHLKELSEKIAANTAAIEAVSTDLENHVSSQYGIGDDAIDRIVAEADAEVNGTSSSDS